MLVVAIVAFFIERDRAKTEAREATKLKKIADELGVSEKWHAAEGIGILAGAGYLQDWAKLYCPYPGW